MTFSIKVDKRDGSAKITATAGRTTNPQKQCRCTVVQGESCTAAQFFYLIGTRLYDLSRELAKFE